MSGPLPRAPATALTAAVLVTGAVLSVLPWWKAGVPLVNATGAALAAGRLTGLVGGYLLLVEVALIARTPWMETRVGTDRVTAWHRALGEVTVGVLVVHAVLLVIGYAAARRVGLSAQVAQIVVVFPGGLTATVGTALLVVVGVTSWRGLRRRLGWERWHGLHLLAYAGIGLGFVHQLLLGRDLSDPRVAVLWTGAHAAVGLAVVWSRVLTPLRLSARHRLRVVSVTPEGPGTVSIVVGGRWLAAYPARPGQFLRWRFLARGLWGQAHPYSLSAAPGAQGLRLTVRTTISDHAARLAEVRPGTPVVAEGPSGALGQIVAEGRPLLLLAAGVGVTPLRALLDAPRPPGVGIPVLVQRVSTTGDLLFAEEIAELVARDRVRHIPLVGGAEQVRLDAAGLRDLVPDLAERAAVVCGPEPLMRQVCSSLRAAGIPRRHIHTERFRLA